MRSHLVLATLISLALGCSRTPNRTPQPRRPTAAPSAATPSAAAPSAAAPEATPTAAAPPPATPTAATPEETPTAAPSHAAPPTAVLAPQRWPGEATSLADAAGQASAIVVARLGALGRPSAAAMEVTAFDATRWTVNRTLRGTPQGPLTLALRVQTLPADQVEQVPRPGEDYVLFLAGGSNGVTEIRKIVPATPENLTRVEQVAR